MQIMKMVFATETVSCVRSIGRKYSALSNDVSYKVVQAIL